MLAAEERKSAVLEVKFASLQTKLEETKFEAEKKLQQAESKCDLCRNALRKGLACLENFVAIDKQERLALRDEQCRKSVFKCAETTFTW